MKGERRNKKMGSLIRKPIFDYLNSKLFNECAVGVVGFAVADDKELTVFEMFLCIYFLDSDIL